MALLPWRWSLGGLPAVGGARGWTQRVGILLLLPFFTVKSLDEGLSAVSGSLFSLQKEFV